MNPQELHADLSGGGELPEQQPAVAVGERLADGRTMAEFYAQGGLFAENCRRRGLDPKKVEAALARRQRQDRVPLDFYGVSPVASTDPDTAGAILDAFFRRLTPELVVSRLVAFLAGATAGPGRQQLADLLIELLADHVLDIVRATWPPSSTGR